MSIQEVNLKIQSAHELLNMIKHLLAATKTAASGDSKASETWEHLNRVLHYLQAKFNSLETSLVSDGNISNTLGGLQLIVNALEQYKENNNTDYFSKTTDSIDKQLHHFIGLPDIKTKSEIAELLKSAKSYQAYAAQQIDILKDEIDKFRKEKSVAKNELLTFKTEFKTQQDELDASLKEQTAALIKELDARKAEAETIIGFISIVGDAGVYQITANEDRKTAEKWETYAKRTFYCWLSFVIVRFAVALYMKTESDWPTVVQQLLMSSPFFLLAGFSALQVSQHRRAERRNRRSELELATLNPYLASLPPEVQNDVKQLLAEKLFGQHESERQKIDAAPWLKLLTDLAKKLHQK